MLVLVVVMQKAAPVATRLNAAHGTLPERCGHRGVFVVVALTAAHRTVVCVVTRLYTPDENAIRTEGVAIRTASWVFQDAITNNTNCMNKYL